MWFFVVFDRTKEGFCAWKSWLTIEVEEASGVRKRATVVIFVKKNNCYSYFEKKITATE
jgi:hypothetical protein